MTDFGQPAPRKFLDNIDVSFVGAHEELLLERCITRSFGADDAEIPDQIEIPHRSHFLGEFQ